MMRTHEGTVLATTGSLTATRKLSPILPYDHRLHYPETLPERGRRAESKSGLPVMRPLFLHYEDDVQPTP